MSEFKAFRDNWPIIIAVLIGAVGYGTLRADVTANAAARPKTEQLQTAVADIRVKQGRLEEQIKALQTSQTVYQRQTMERLREQKALLDQILTTLLAQ